MVWANFLHIYQPPTQKLSILEKVVNESYRRVIQGLLDNPQAKLTLNINGVLTEMLAENGFMDIVENLKQLLDRGQIELTGSAMYHAFLPKLPESEISRQIKLNEEINVKYFGGAYKPKGFFPPEMAINEKVRKVVEELGYEWIIVDELASPKKIDPTKIYKQEGTYIFFREREMSFKILSAQLGSASLLISELKHRLSNNEYLLTAMDGETFGHHRVGLENLLLDIYKSAELPTVTISELPKMFPNHENVTASDSNWAMKPRDVSRGVPFLRWDDPENPIHKLQWELVYLAIEAVNTYGPNARHMLDKSLHSDQFWWASAKPWWSLEMIEGGAHELYEAVNACLDAPEELKAKAKDLYLNIITTGFEWQRDGTVESLSKAEDEEIRSQFSQEEDQTTLDEYNKIIEILMSQMKLAAQNHEFEQAANLKRRINELKTYRDKQFDPAKIEIRANQ